MFADDMNLYTQKIINRSPETTGGNHEFGQVAGYKTNALKSLAFLYTNKSSEREIKKTIPFTTATKRIKYPGINLPKEAKT